MAAAAPVFFALSLMTECQRWSQRAILALDEESLGGRQEMRLQAALALSSMWTAGKSDVTFAALYRSIEIAKHRRDPIHQILLLAPLHVFHMITAEFAKSLQYAEQVAELSQTTQDRMANDLSKILLGYSLHFAGDLPAARRELEAALTPSSGDARRYDLKSSSSETMMEDAMGAPILALASSAAPSALARTLWLQGDIAAALHLVNQTIADTATIGHPVAVLVALIYAISVMLWNGDLEDAKKQVTRFVLTAESYNLPQYISLGRCFEGNLEICNGNFARGIELITEYLANLRAIRYELMTTLFNIALVQALLSTARLDEGLALLDVVIESVQTNGDLCYLPELLRLKANILLERPQPLVDLAESYLGESLTLSRRQGALAWELRTSIDVATRLGARGELEQAKALLGTVCERFSKSARTADLRTAEGLLEIWG